MKAFLPFLILFLFAVSCNHNTEHVTHLQDDEFEAVNVIYSTGFKIWENELYYKIEVRNPQDSSLIMGNYLLSKNAERTTKDTIAVPISNAAINSTTFAAYFDALGEVKTVKGGTYLDKLMNIHFKESFEKGNITELTSAGSIDFEKVLALNPDIFMVYDFGDSNFDRIRTQGIPVVFNMEYMESSPLGRVEWIKLVGCFTGKLLEATAIFDSISNRYNDMKRGVLNSKVEPNVFTGSRYKDFWYAPGNDSYIAQFIRDAGGKYAFENYEGNGSVELEYESALQQISNADFWGMVVYEEEGFTSQHLSDMNTMYESFKSFKEGNVFVCNAAQSDFFGDAVMQPDIVLSDLISMFHPEYLPNHRQIYFYDLQP